MNETRKHPLSALLMVAAGLFAGPLARADVVTEWNVKAGEIVVEARLGPPPANRVLAIVQTAVYEAANTVTQRYPASGLKLEAAPGASPDAAIAAANRATLSKLLPSQQAAIDTPIRLRWRRSSTARRRPRALQSEKRRPRRCLRCAPMTAPPERRVSTATTAGVYVPTVVPVVPQWPQRKPWLMTSPAQFRPGPPPALTSELWARDYNEIKASAARAARTAPPSRLDRPLLGGHAAPDLPRCRALGHQRARAGGHAERTPVRGSHSGEDDALIAILDAKYHYNFWRPVTAIRQMRIDGNDATERGERHGRGSTHRHTDAPRVSVRALHRCGAVWHGAAVRKSAPSVPTLATTSLICQGAARKLRLRGSTTSCRRWRMRASTMGCTTTSTEVSGTAMGTGRRSWPRLEHLRLPE